MPIQPKGKREMQDAEVHARNISGLQRLIVPLFWALILGGVLACGIMLYYFIQLLSAV